MKTNCLNDLSGVGSVTPCAPPVDSKNSAHGVTRPTFRNQRAFTMIEIAIALAVIAFALVAIIGVLPTGLTVQRDNREDTIVNQDGPYWLEAIRTGAQGLDHLTNFVEIVTIKRLGTYNGNFVDDILVFTNDPGLFPPPVDGSMTNGRWIIGLLSTPKYDGDPTNPTNRITNSVSARIRALTGAAVEQGTASPDFSFSYLLVPEIIPFIGIQIPVSSTNYLFENEPTPPTQEETDAAIAARRIEWSKVKSRERNASEIRLTFKWPLLPDDRTGPNRQSFRALVIGEPKDIDGLRFFQPQSFVAVPAP